MDAGSIRESIPAGARNYGCVDARVPGADLVRALRSDLGQSSERQFLDYKLTVSASPD